MLETLMLGFINCD